MPSGYHLGCKTKAPNDLPSSRSNHLALALRLWLIFTFTIDSRLHNLQYSGKSVSSVDGRTRCCVARPHNGQISLPSADTNSIPRRSLDCKSFCRPFLLFIYCLKSNYRCEVVISGISKSKVVNVPKVFSMRSGNFAPSNAVAPLGGW